MAWYRGAKHWDFRSDTVTIPTQGMLEAMIAAEVGDDVRQEDPTARALEVQSVYRSAENTAIHARDTRLKQYVN